MRTDSATCGHPTRDPGSYVLGIGEPAFILKESSGMGKVYTSEM